MNPRTSRRTLGCCYVALLLACTGSWGLSQAASDRISLAGEWRLELDAKDRGLADRWHNRVLANRVRLPGALSAQGIGDDVSLATPWTGSIVDRSWFTAPEYEPYRQPGHIKVPFWLQPEKYYSGAAWYQREIDVPSNWRGKRIVLLLERPHWETRVWLDDRLIGANNSLSTPHEYDLGSPEPGQHRLTIRVDNRMVVDVGENSHSVSDHTQGNWNGMAGRLELRATAKVWIEDLQVYPRISSKTILVKGVLGNATDREGQGHIRYEVRPAFNRHSSIICRKETPMQWATTGGNFETELNLGDDAPLWDEFHPAAFRLDAGLSLDTEVRTVVFGLREATAPDTQFRINGRKTFIRGTLECCIFPKTGHPPTDVDSWRRIVHIAKAHGLNNLRFHSWCPPEAAFLAADELGLYLHVECGSWPNQSTTLGDGKPVDTWIYLEADKILRAYGNHPSFVFMLHGNEPGGKNHAQFLARWVEHFKNKDPRRLYSGGAGWPQLPQNQFHVVPDPRIQAWGGGLKSRINALPPETETDYRSYIQARPVPVVSHEIGQWCVYPNFSEMTKYTGYLKPRNFEIFRESLNQHHMLDQARDFLLASGKLQALCYKEDIESALRTPGMGGFQLLDLHDFPGQGTALVGVLDPFWDAKGYITAREYRRFAGETVPLALMQKRVFSSDEDFTATVKLAHFGPDLPAGLEALWQLRDSRNRIVARDSWGHPLIEPGNNNLLGHITVPLRSVPAPQKLVLTVSLKGTPCANDWDLWIYPSQVDTQVPSGITVTEDLDSHALSALDAGGKVLWLLPKDRVAADRFGKVGLGFSSIFWNTAWTQRQMPHTLGILCQPRHALFREFPTEFHSNWQWWYLIQRAGAMILDEFPAELQPVVQVIDDWFTNRKLGLLFEARVNEGRLLVCSIDLTHHLDHDLVARQFRHSLLRYMDSASFKPKIRLAPEQVRAIRTSP